MEAEVVTMMFRELRVWMKVRQTDQGPAAIGAERVPKPAGMESSKPTESRSNGGEIAGWKGRALALSPVLVLCQ